jgi:hypothetical protein
MPRLFARTLVAAATLASAVVGLAPGASATPGPCPGGESPCVYLPAGTYPLGNIVGTGTGIAPSSTVLLHHCDTNTGECYDTTLNLPGFAVTSTPSAILTLTIPGEGVGLSGTTPVLYLGLPTAGLVGTKLGLTLTVTGTAFVLWDTSINATCSAPKPIPPVTPSVSGYAGCWYSLTVSV